MAWKEFKVMRGKIMVAAICSLLQLGFGNSATAQQKEEADRKWHFVNGLSDMSLPDGCHAQLYERPVVADDGVLQLLPVDHIHFADITCIGSSIYISNSIFTNGGDVRIFAHDLTIAPTASIDTRVYLPKSFTFVENLFEHSDAYYRRNLGLKSYSHFLANQYSKSFLTVLANYYEACFDCKIKGGQVFAPRLPDGLPIVQHYPAKPDIIENDIESAEASIIENNLTSGDINLHLSGSLKISTRPMVSGIGYQYAVPIEGKLPNSPNSPIFTEDRRFVNAFRIQAPYPSRPWLVGLPSCGSETMVYSLGAGYGYYCKANHVADRGNLRPVALEAKSGQISIRFTDLGNLEVSQSSFNENLVNPYAFKINDRPIFGAESSFDGLFGNYIGHAIPLNYRPRISADLVPKAQSTLHEINPKLTDGSPGGLIDDTDPEAATGFSYPFAAHQVQKVTDVDVLFSGFMENVYARRLARILMGAIDMEAEATKIQGDYVLSDMDFIVLTLNQTTRAVLHDLVRAEIDRGKARPSPSNLMSADRSCPVAVSRRSDIHPFQIMSRVANPSLAGRPGDSLHALAMANEISCNAGRPPSSLIAGISETYGGLLNHLRSDPVVASERYTNSFIALESIRSDKAVEAQIKLMRQEHLATYRFLVDHMTASRVESMQSKIKQLEAAVARAKSDGSLIAMAKDIPKIWKSAESSGKGAAKFLAKAGITVNPAAIAAAVAAFSVYEAVEKRDALGEAAKRDSDAAAELRQKMIEVAEEGKTLTTDLGKRLTNITLARNESLIEALLTLDTQEIDIVLALLGRLALEATLPPTLGRSEFDNRLGYLESYLTPRMFGIANSVALSTERVTRLKRVSDWTCSSVGPDCICLDDIDNSDPLTSSVFVKTSLFGEAMTLRLASSDFAGPICLLSFGFSHTDITMK